MWKLDGTQSICLLGMVPQPKRMLQEDSILTFPISNMWDSV